MNSLPRYTISIDPALSENGEILGISQIALTSTPAIIIKGMAFNSDTKKMIFVDTLKYRLAAPALIPDMPIYRKDDELGEYEVVFTKETIELLRQEFMLNKGQIVFNLDHTTQEAPSYILDSWITGPSQTDPSFTKYGVECPEGSWFIVSQFTNKEYFKNEVIAKDRLGYSIEGFLGLEMNKIKEQLKLNKMTKQKFEKAILEDGTALFISKMEVGGEVFVIDENGDKTPLFDGEHKLKDGSGVVTVAGKITEIKPKAEEVAQEEVAPVAAEVVTPEVVLEVAPVEQAVAPEVAPVAPVAIDEAAILAVIQPKLDELYKVIADIKTLIESDNAEDVIEEVPVQMNGQQALASYFAAINS